MMAVRVTCIAQGLPSPDITFLKGIEEFTCSDPGMSCNISNGVITFIQPMQSDSSRYSCRAITRLFGSDVGTPSTKTIDLQYCTRPAISNVSTAVTVMSGQSATLSCMVSGLPVSEVRVNWTFNMAILMDSPKYSIAVSAGSNYQLTINDAESSDFGTYRCTAFHRLLSNTETRSVMVTVTAPPGVELPVWSYPLMGLAGVVVILLLIAVVFLAILCCCYSDKRGGYAPGGKAGEGTDGRGNVDKDSDDEAPREEPEEFRPQYESLPALRPALPPQYKPSPSYNQQYGDDMEMVKVPPPETDSTAFEFHPYRPDNGSVVGSAVGGEGYPAQQARFDDFMSDDGQFV